MGVATITFGGPLTRNDDEQKTNKEVSFPLSNSDLCSTMVVIGSRSKSSSTLLKISSVAVWRILFAVIILIYPLSLLLFYDRYRNPTNNNANNDSSASTGGTRGGGGTNAPNRNGSNDIGKANTDTKDHVSQSSSNKPVIGYAISITGCGSDPLTEG